MAETKVNFAVVGAIGVVLGAIISGNYSLLGHQSDVDAKMIELAVGILRAEPTPETTPLREWAIEVIDKRAQFRFNASQRALLLKKELPFTGGFSSGFGSGVFSPVPPPPTGLPPLR
jgi:hypothetical protein